MRELQGKRPRKKGGKQAETGRFLGEENKQAHQETDQVWKSVSDESPSCLAKGKCDDGCQGTGDPAAVAAVVGKPGSRMGSLDARSRSPLTD